MENYLIKKYCNILAFCNTCRKKDFTHTYRDENVYIYQMLTSTYGK